MQNHPDIEELLENTDSKEVSEHLKICEVCSATAADIAALKLTAGDLTAVFNVSEAKNEQVIKEITVRASEIRRILFRRSFLLKASSVAAMLILGGVWLWQGNESTGQKTGGKSAADFNKDGRTNVIDSYLLAKALKSGEKPAADLDFNGITDEKDLLELRRQIVAAGEKK